MKARSYLHSVTKLDREGDIEVSIVARMNGMTEGGGRRRGQMIGQNPKAGSSALFVRGNRGKEIQFLWRRSPWKDVRTWCQKIPKYVTGEMNSFRTAVGVTRYIETVAKTPGKDGKNFGQEVNRCLPAKFYRTPLARKRNLRRNPSKTLSKP